MRNKRVLSLLLAMLLLLTMVTACGKKKEAPEKDVEEVPLVTSLAEAKTAIESGHYEAAYLYLLTDTSEEAQQLINLFCYVPVEFTNTWDNGAAATGRWSYDDAGYLLTEKVTTDFPEDEEFTPSVVGHTVTCAYDEWGNMTLIAIVDQGSDGEEEQSLRTYTYDADGNQLTQEHQDADGRWTKMVCTYDEKGNRLSHEITYDTDTWNRTVYTYDADGNALTMEYTDSDGDWSKSTYTYDADGNKLTSESSDSDGGWTKQTYTYDADGNKLTEEYTDANGDVAKYRYSTQRDFFGQIVTYSYNKSYESVIDPETHENMEKGRWREREYTYDDAGNLLEGYDWTEYLVAAEDSSGGRYTIYTCDEKGNYLTYEEGTYSEHDDRKGSAVVITSRKYEYTYDANGDILTQREGRIGVSGVETGYSLTTYTRNEKGYVMAEKWELYEFDEWYETKNTTYTRDDEGRMLSKKTEHYDYDGWIRRESYTYDEQGNVLIQESVDGDGTWEKETNYYRGNYRYDRVKEYERANGDYCKCTFDEKGNVLTKEESSDGEITKTVYTYDSNGHRLSEKITHADGSWRKETTNAAGCVLSYETSTGEKMTITWELRYIPDDVQSAADEALDLCARTVNALRQRIYSAYDWVSRF